MIWYVIYAALYVIEKVRQKLGGKMFTDTEDRQAEQLMQELDSRDAL